MQRLKVAKTLILFVTLSIRALERLKNAIRQSQRDSFRHGMRSSLCSGFRLSYSLAIVQGRENQGQGLACPQLSLRPRQSERISRAAL